MSQRFVNIIRRYKAFKQHNPDTWMQHCVGQADLTSAIKCAALSRDADGRKHPHQYRLEWNHLSSFADNLVQREQEIKLAKGFDDLFKIVESSKAFGIGPLAVYDTSVRIGAYLDLFPEKIYLHAGTKLGAEGLLGPLNSSTLLKSDLPGTFAQSDLTCYELEDILCIFKAIFTRRH